VWPRRQELCKADINRFVEGIFGELADLFLRDAVARADRIFRKTLFEAALSKRKSARISRYVFPDRIFQGVTS
jgi:hypothetical protein